MAASWIQLYIKINDKPASWTTEQFASKAIGADGRLSARRAYQAIWDILGGNATVWLHVTDDSGAYPAGAIGVTQANAAGDTITFTWKTKTVVLTEGATGVNGFSRGTSDATLATNLAATIRKHPILGGLFTPTAGASSVALAAKVAGTPLTKVTITTSDATAFAITNPTGATDAAASFFVQSIWRNRR